MFRPKLAGLMLAVALAAGIGVGAWPAFAAGGGHLPGPIPARILAVIDGDTIEVEARIWLDQSVRTRVRLLGIDTPERKAACSAERALAERARAFTAERLSAGLAQLLDVDYDKYGRRVLARILTSSGEDLGQALIGAGLARAYDGGKRQGWCAAS